MILEQAAEVWYNDLPQVVKNDWDRLEEAFNQKYIDGNNLNWVKEQDWYTRVQRKDESVESYIMDIRQKCHQLQKGDAETRSLIVRGLLPPIKAAFVLGQQPENSEELEEKTKLAETIENPAGRQSKPDARYI